MYFNSYLKKVFCVSYLKGEKNLSSIVLEMLNISSGENWYIKYIYSILILYFKYLAPIPAYELRNGYSRGVSLIEDKVGPLSITHKAAIRSLREDILIYFLVTSAGNQTLSRF